MLALFAGIYLASPYWAVYNFKQAATSADADKLEGTVDFSAVRESLKSQMTAALMKKMADDPAMKDNPFAGLGALMMPTIVEKMVDSFVTPAGISSLAKGNKPSDSSVATEPNEENISYTNEYVSLDRFRVRLFNKKQRRAGPSLLFERRGIVSWKMVRVELPADLLD